MQQSLSVKDDGSYQFYYETGKDGGSHSRSEVRHPDGVVIGKYSYEDPNGDIREVRYRADDSGYVENGGVSVEEAPKDQFPAAPEDEIQDPNPSPAQVEEGNQQNPEETPVEKQAAEHKDEDRKAEDEMKDLAIDESAMNDPPEGFPQGFFLQHFQGLRRLPEPTKEEDLTTAAPQPEEAKEEPTAVEVVDGPSEEMQDKDYNPEDPNKNKLANEMGMFMHLRPFQGFEPHQMGSSMFHHQPVYVFSYQHPDSYGYHYYFWIRGGSSPP